MGVGIPKDDVQAYQWLSLAASPSPNSERQHREEAVTERDRVAAKMAPAQIAEVQTLAREWKPAPTPSDADHRDASKVDAGAQ